MWGGPPGPQPGALARPFDKSGSCGGRPGVRPTKTQRRQALRRPTKSHIPQVRLIHTTDRHQRFQLAKSRPSTLFIASRLRLQGAPSLEPRRGEPQSLQPELRFQYRHTHIHQQPGLDIDFTSQAAKWLSGAPNNGIVLIGVDNTTKVSDQWLSATCMSRSVSYPGNGRNRIEFTTENIVEFAPIPSASVTTAPNVNTGLRRNPRNAMVISTSQFQIAK